MPDMEVELITIGDELLLGFTIDTNAAHLARELASIGIGIRRRASVGDVAEDIAAAVRNGIERTGAVITTGGLGPTSDDLTKPSIAALFGRRMALDEEHVAWMEQRWLQRFQRKMPESNRAQAMIPEGATKLANRHGSAPGIWLEDEQGRWVAMLPGVPREMKGMLADTLLPRLRERTSAAGALTVVRSRTLRTTGVAESLLADQIDPVREQLGPITLAYLPGADGVDLRLTTRGVSLNGADEILSTAAELLRAKLGRSIYAEGDADLTSIVLDRCRDLGYTIAVAESCTGGLLGARLTSIPGSSEVVLGGVIAYANEVKLSLLGVDAADLAKHGAVSEQIARQMAEGVRGRLGATIGISITGVAGPGGGTPEKPVGTVWIAGALPEGTRAVQLKLIGDREEIRRRATQSSLELVRRALLERD
ncbi:MAG TPA: competence/damage-inducible protein A [Gemmatimonadaceae bacterium]|nr:competence/damage-inducible protein A [Gemmatimonadaceae bacterium]